MLSQYLWPDDAPTGLYAEQLADALSRDGQRVVLVGGEGTYRSGKRPPPHTPIERVKHLHGKRGNLPSSALEYVSVQQAFRRYIASAVGRGDVVIVTSAPPTTLGLHREIRRAGAVGVYWLQDFYPELLRGLWDAPAVVRAAMARFWTAELRRWPRVVKAAGNLGYDGPNACVVRNWETLDVGPPRPPKPRTALYSGNLGYAHDVPSFVAACERLRTDGYAVTVRGDGPGMQQLPAWIRVEPPLADTLALVESLWDAELHLIAGHPRFGGAVFPSKFWNVHATGRQVMATGFDAAMTAELAIAQATPAGAQLQAWTELVSSLTLADRREQAEPHAL